MSEHQFQFTHDWISHAFPLWEKIILPHKDRIGLILEIGCFEGRASVWFLQNIPDAYLIAVDNFEGDEDLKRNKIDFSDTLKVWFKNTHPWFNSSKLRVGQSWEILGELNYNKQIFGLILVDGDHSAQGCLSDLVMSWHLLNKGGFMIIDDYGWGNGRPELETPKPAIDAFLKIYAPEIEVLHLDYQAIVRRK